MSPGYQHFKIKGMHCVEEIATLKKLVGPLVGGEDNLSFDLLNAKMSIKLPFDKEWGEEEIKNAVARGGMQASIWKSGLPGTAKGGWERSGPMILLCLSGAFLLAGFVLHWALEGSFLKAFAAGEQQGHQFPRSVLLLYAGAIVSAGWFVFPKAWLALKRLSPDMNLLMAIAVLGAWAIGAWFEAATVTFLFSLSLVLEAWSIGRARKAVAALMDLAPLVVQVVHEDGTESDLPPEEVAVGTHFIVKPGARIPLDGVIVKGASEVNQAPITGESIPIDKLPGDPVFAGTVNGNGALEIRSTKEAQETVLAHIISQVGSAQSKRSASERWVDHFARYYTPLVILFALGTLAIPTLIFGGSWNEWIYRALVLLVIACPCALVISTPVSMVVGLAAAARNGVLVKGGLYLEVMDKVKAIAFDKTGTLTKGVPVVQEIIPLNGHSEMELLTRVASLEARSNHPLAKAVIRYAESKGVDYSPAENYQIIQGKGATALFDGRSFWLGSHRYLEERGQETQEMHEKLEEMSAKGHTVVVVGNEQHVCGLIAISDEVRPEARVAIEELRKCGVRHLVMLTGDNQGTAQTIARQTGVDEVFAELLPEDKVKVIEKLTQLYGKSAMVGDGVNDAPAMAGASVGIAMGAVGSDAAIETADIALMSDDLARISWLMKLSRRTLMMIRQNTLFSLSIKALFVVLTFSGYAYLWAAIAADTGASLLVIFNSLRLLNTKHNKLNS